MTFQDDPDTIQWRMHLKSAPEQVFAAIATDEGRREFWAETAVEEDGHVHFKFPNGMEWVGKILENDPPTKFCVEYFGSTAQFDLKSDGKGGTDLTLTDTGVPAEHKSEVTAGWVSVLMTLKGSVDFSVDLRNHDATKTWSQGYADN